MTSARGSADQGWGPGHWSRVGLIAAVVLVGFWSVLIGQVERSVFGRVPILDEVYYLDRAAEIVSGPREPAEPYFMSPLYPHLLAAVGGGVGVPASRVFAGPELRGVRLLQIGCWLGTLVLIRLLAGHLVPGDWRGGRRAMALWLPVLLYALYRPAAVYALAILLETTFVFCVALSALLMVRLGRRGRPGAQALLLGVTLGLAVLLRGTALLLVPVACGVLWRRFPRRQLWPPMLLLVAGLSLALGGTVWHNSRLAGSLVGPTLNGGVNLYIGNGPAANGFYVAAIPGDWREDPAGRAFLAERFDRPRVSLAAADSIWSAEAWHEMRGNPGRVVALAAKKIWLQLQGWEIDQLTPLAGWTRAAPLLRLLVTPYSLLVVLGLLGLAEGRRNPTVLLVGGLLLVLILGQSLFFVVSRYRLVLAMLLAALAGIGGVRLWDRPRHIWWLVVPAVLVTVPWGLGSVRTSWAALAQANEALRWADVGLADESDAANRRAEELYRQSLRRAPDRPASWLGLAAVLGAMGRGSEEIAVLNEGLKSVADPVPLQKALLARQLAANEGAAAQALAREILRRKPRDADTLHNLAVLLARSGALDEGLANARRLRRFHPGDPRGHIDVGVILARSGRRAEARTAFEAGLRECPGNAELRQNLSVLAE